MRHFSRREFLATAAAVPALTCLPSKPVEAEEQAAHQAPYEALRRFIQPGEDEFPEEKIAFEIRAALERALHSGELPTTDPQAALAWRTWVESLGSLRRAHFYPLPSNIVRFEVTGKHDGKLYHRVGRWELEWRNGKTVHFAPLEEHTATADEPFFRDVSAAVFANVPSFSEQLSKGVPYWRARLDPASGIDIYGSNGLAVGDIDE